MASITRNLSCVAKIGRLIISKLTNLKDHGHLDDIEQDNDSLSLIFFNRSLTLTWLYKLGAIRDTDSNYRCFVLFSSSTISVFIVLSERTISCTPNQGPMYRVTEHHELTVVLIKFQILTL